MPVIGKLDKQVHDILIAPLADPNTSARETHQETDPPQSEHARTREITANEKAHAEKTARAQASLPVWLL